MGSEDVGEDEVVFRILKGWIKDERVDLFGMVLYVKLSFVYRYCREVGFNLI